MSDTTLPLPQASTAVPPAPTFGRTEIVFVESNVAAYQTLLNGLDPGVKVHVLDAAQEPCLAPLSA